MRTNLTATAALLFSAACLFHMGCTSIPDVHTVPITGRKTVLHIPEPQEIEMGLTAYEDATQKVPPSTNQHYIDVVNRVGKRIAAVAERDDYDWEFRVLASAEQNAFCLPGGKVAIHEGIMPVCESEAGVAVVMAHEVAHALARHGGERVRNKELTDQAQNYLGSFMQKQEPLTQELVMKAYGVSSEYGFIKPYSRKHESEADHMGLILMARAGYDPAEAPRFWQRFAAMKQGGQTPEFLSTHPSDERRAADLMELLPDAQTEYLAATEKLQRGEMLVIAPLPQAPASPPASLAQRPTNGVLPSGYQSGPGVATPTFTPIGTGALPQPPMILPQQQRPMTEASPLDKPAEPTDTGLLGPSGEAYLPPSRSFQ